MKICDLENRPKDIAIEVEELNEDDKGSTIIKNKALKPLKTLEEKKIAGDDKLTWD